MFSGRTFGYCFASVLVASHIDRTSGEDLLKFSLYDFDRCFTENKAHWTFQVTNLSGESTVYSCLAEGPPTTAAVLFHVHSSSESGGTSSRPYITRSTAVVSARVCRWYSVDFGEVRLNFFSVKF